MCTIPVWDSSEKKRIEVHPLYRFSCNLPQDFSAEKDLGQNDAHKRNRSYTDYVRPAVAISAIHVVTVDQQYDKMTGQIQESVVQLQWP